MLNDALSPTLHCIPLKRQRLSLAKRDMISVCQISVLYSKVDIP